MVFKRLCISGNLQHLSACFTLTSQALIPKKSLAKIHRYLLSMPDVSDCLDPAYPLTRNPHRAHARRCPAVVVEVQETVAGAGYINLADDRLPINVGSVHIHDPARVVRIRAAGYNLATDLSHHVAFSVGDLSFTLSMSLSYLLWISPRAISISPLHVSPHFHS